MQIGAIALKELVRSQRQENVKIARRPTADAGLAFARKPDPGSIFHALRNIDRQRPLACRATGTRACGTRILDHLAAALAARAGSLQREKSLGLPHPASPATHRTGLGLGAGLGAGAGTRLASNRDRDLDLGGLAEEGLFEGDFHIVAQVGAALAATATPALPGHAEQVLEDIGERGGKARAEARSTATLLECGMTETVIGGALVAILEDFVGFVDFLEANLAGGIAWILVRMPFHCQLAESGLETRVISGSVNFQGFVVATLGGHSSNPPEFRPHPEEHSKSNASRRMQPLA